MYVCICVCVVFCFGELSDYSTVVLDLADENAGAIGLHFGASDMGSFVLNLALQVSDVRSAVATALE